MLRAMETTDNRVHGGFSAKPFAKLAAAGAVGIERSRCYNRKSRGMEACYDI